MALVSAVLVATGCSKRERSDPDAEEWAEIEALADDAPIELADDNPAGKVMPDFGEEIPLGEFRPFLNRLALMKSIERGEGETLISGEKMLFDYDKQFLRLQDHVVIEDDEGTLTAMSLTGRFTISNEVETVEAAGNVELVGSNRTVLADHAIYHHKDGLVQLTGKASASYAGNRLSGERIRLWIQGDRKMVCEPDALLEISGESGLPLDGISTGTSTGAAGKTEIRADKATYDEAERLAQLIGNVRLRDRRAAMNCENVRLYLKDDNEIDWIEALDEVIIQIGEVDGLPPNVEFVRALSERAVFRADEKMFTLEKQPVVKAGQHVMTGEQIKLWIDPWRMVCEPKARVLLHLDEETKTKFLKDLDR